MIRAFVIVAVAIAVMAAACGDGTSPSGGQTPPERTPPVEQPGDAGFRQFASDVQDALARQDVEFFLNRAQTTKVVCTAEDLQGGLGGPLCEFEGQTYDGFPIGRWRSEGNIVPVADALSQLEMLFENVLPSAEDGFGDGEVLVYALSLDGRRADAVITGLIERPASFAGSGPLRGVVVSSWSFERQRWTLTSVLGAFVLGEEFLIPCEAALQFLGGAWERYPDRTQQGLGEERCPFQEG